MKKTLVIHPFLFAIFPILFLFSHNRGRVAIDAIVAPTVITLLFTLLLWASLSFIVKDKKKAGMIVSPFLLLFFSYGHFYDAIPEFSFVVAGLLITPNRILLPVYGILFLLCAYSSVRTRRSLNDFTNILNILAGSLVVICLISIGAPRLETRTMVSSWDSRSLENRNSSTIGLGRADSLPDIYYIILDSYASSSTLKEIYGYDNREFEDYLTGKGFYIASEARSNYAISYLSVTSSLNMQYINDISDIVGVPYEDRPYQMLRDHRVGRYLTDRGYTYVHFNSGAWMTGHNRYADWNIDCGMSADEFQVLLFRTTIVFPFEPFLHLMRRAIRERWLCTFSVLSEVQHRTKSPIFVFAHIIPPHPPYIFGPNGEEVAERELRLGYPSSNKQRYVDQLVFISRKVEELVKEILSEADAPPIIILQADHGPESTGGWDQPTERMIIERMRILNAYYLPNNGQDLLYDSITPVNTFRLIFSHYFNAGYDLLDDKVYFSTYEQPYEFIDVTHEIDWHIDAQRPE